jgi:hypothetical protein
MVIQYFSEALFFFLRLRFLLYQMPVETIHVQSLIERGSGLEHMILLRCGQEGIEVVLNL